LAGSVVGLEGWAADPADCGCVSRSSCSNDVLLDWFDFPAGGLGGGGGVRGDVVGGVVLLLFVVAVDDGGD